MSLLNSYQHVVVGKSYVSLIFAIIQKARHQLDNLVVDDARFCIGDKWTSNIGELEKKALRNLGELYGISCLVDIERYTEQSNTMILLNEKMIELGSSAFANIKELARKLPDCFSESFIERLSSIEAQDFDSQLDEYFDRVVERAFTSGGANLFQAQSQLLEPVFARFLEHLQSDKLVTKQLHFTLQALYQTILSSTLSESEARYLLASTLSPRYKLDTGRLEDELTFVYKTMGGDTKKALVQEFEIYKGRLEYVLLDSHEGVVKASQVFLFGHFGKEIPFEYEPGQTVFKSIAITCPIEHKFASRFVDKRIIFSNSDRMGTDFPHWEMTLDRKGIMRATYAYADYEGAKPSFYHKNASEDLFRSLSSTFPGISESDWNSQIDFGEGTDVWLDNPGRSSASRRLSLKSQLGSECLYQGSRVEGVRYCGPLRARYLGYFGYILNILAN